MMMVMTLTTNPTDSSPVVGGFYRDVNAFNAVWRIDWVGRKVVTNMSTTWLVQWTRLQPTVFGFCNEEPMRHGAMHFDPTYYKRVHIGP